MSSCCLAGATARWGFGGTGRVATTACATTPSMGCGTGEKEIFDGVDTSLRSLLTFDPQLLRRWGGLDGSTQLWSRTSKAMADGGEARPCAVDDGLNALARSLSLAAMNLHENARSRYFRSRTEERSLRRRDVPRSAS